MRKFSHHQCLLLLLLLLASQLSLTVHAANHLDPDASSCQLCIGYHNSGHAIAKALPSIEPVFTSYIFRNNTLAPVLTRKFLPYQQRAPPHHA